MYIALEGIDTAGKSTQIQALKSVLLKDVFFTQEPYDYLLGKDIKDLILSNDMSSKCEFFLFLANRAEHIKQNILPHINKTIISDRSLISGISYASGIDDKDAIFCNKIAVDNILPDKIIILNLKKDELQKRLLSKKNINQEDKIEQRGIDYLIGIQERMINICKKINIPHLIIDASNTQEQITNQIQDFIGL